MILRSLTKHVTDQNWFAVALDFAIVVFGVYVGLQVQEWSDMRALEASEAQYLAELHEEITQNTKLTSSTVEGMNDVVSSGKRALEFLQSDRRCEEDCWRVLVDLFVASQVFRPAVSTTVYEEMQRLGFPRSMSVRSAVDDYYVLNATAYLGVDSSPKYRVSFRELITVEAHEQLWSQCHKLDGYLEYLIADCPPGMSTQSTRVMLDRIRSRPEVLDQLRYWIGMHSLWIPVFNDMLIQAKHATSAIEAEQAGN
ncbi:hypothetical protein R0135_10145 [Congregibacter variabilis]|uniref:Uncharacterized protein n=1 Tax=Congregibacter variabilis TaxID=3081200 RepID=A0ABZ0HZH6_9GAMM|nr:hypothetical protein R0135_10145 [Congregibacter sp. IMCC43200]